MRIADTVRKFSLFWLILLTAGCSAGFQPVCRHTALMCALVMQEKYNNVEVAFGPVINANREADPLITHAQTRVMVDEKWVWVNYVGGTCQLTNYKERFLDLNHYSAGMFYAWLWKTSDPAMDAPLPVISFKDAISIRDVVIR